MAFCQESSLGDEHGNGGSGVDEDDQEGFRPWCWSLMDNHGDDDDVDDDVDGGNDGDDKEKFWQFARGRGVGAISH